MRRAMPSNPTSRPSQSSRFTFASGGVIIADASRLDAVEDRLARRLRQHRSTASRARSFERRGQAVHHPAVPGVRVVLERLAHEAAAEDAALRIGDQQLRMRQLVDAEAAARAARALRIVEHEVGRADVAVDEVVRRAAAARRRTVCASALLAPLTTCTCIRPSPTSSVLAMPGLDRLLVLAADDEAIDDRVHVRDRRLVELDLVGDVDRLAVDDQPRGSPSCGPR